MNKIKYLILTLGIFASFGLASMPLAANATVLDDACTGTVADSPICKDKDANVTDSIKTIVNTLLFVLGAVAVLVIIVAGIMYVVSGGEAASVKKAKDMILYAVVGLVVALMAFAIVNFVVTKMTTPVTPADATTTTTETPAVEPVIQKI